MAFTQIQLDSLEAAIASGTLEVRIGDKLVKYQTTNDLIRARDLMRDQINSANASNRSTYSSFSRD